MNAVRVVAVAWVDEEFLGWVEVHLAESDGSVATPIDKVPVFDCGEALVLGVELPVELEVPRGVLDRTMDRAGNRSMLARLHFDLEDRTGRRTFRVNESDVVERR